MALVNEMELQGNYLFKYRSYIPLIFLGMGMGVLAYEASSVHFDRPLQELLKWAALGVGLLGLIIRIITVGYTPANTSGRNTKEGQVADQLNTTGAYSLVRHPLYVGNFLMWLAIALLSHNLWFCISFILAYYLYYERIMLAEERFLINKFGSNYNQWAAKVPAFIPNRLQWVKPKYPFSLKKVLKKEKNGLFALGLLIYIMHLIESYFLELELYYVHWTGLLALVTGVLYFILKVIKKSAFMQEEGR